jgi:hypothetical protein
MRAHHEWMAGNGVHARHQIFLAAPQFWWSIGDDFKGEADLYLLARSYATLFSG